MKSIKTFGILLFISSFTFGQAGHILQGVGAANMSMGGAATAQPIDISGALQWNPAAISVFEQNTVKLDIGLFFSSPKLSSTVPEFNMMGQPTGNFFSGTTEDDRGVSPLPALAFVLANEDSKSTFGFSAFGISGFGVTFPENPSNPVNGPQSQGGFGRVESDYALFQVGLTWAYELTDEISVGIQPNLNVASLELMPNPTANPSQTAGYPSVDGTTAVGFGGQVGLFYNGSSGFKAGVSYKTNQTFGDFEFENEYLDGSEDTNEFQMDYPAILSLGLGYSTDAIDLALDYRSVNYENTEGFEQVGWTQTASVLGFGWENISIVSFGFQYKGIDKLPLRAGYTYSTNPISEDVAFFNIPATAIIENAFQLGLSYMVSDQFQLDALYHHGMSNGATSGPVLNPAFIQASPPYGAIQGSEVSYDMTTDMVGIGITYMF